MRVFKLIDHNLMRYQNAYNFDTKQYEMNDVVPGIKVCSVQKTNWIGIVTDVGPKVRPWAHSEREYVMDVKVYWLTGPKKGKIEDKKSDNLVNFDWYRSSVQRYADHLKDIDDEAEMARPR